jgi:hypothetical protein
MITYLTSRGLSDAQIQLISGHESKKSLEIYQHLSLGAVQQAYQEGCPGGSATNRHPTMPESRACETFGTFVGI